MFVDGECVATLRDAEAVARLPALLTRSRVEAGQLPSLVGGCAELARLVNELVRRDVLWPEI